jgi:DNA-directed RNA polymerase specialized sigma24 family protein
LGDGVVDHDTLADSFTDFMEDAEPRLRHALCAAFGGDQGRDAAAEALAYGWEHWARVREMENPAGYLWGVGRNHARRWSYSEVAELLGVSKGTVQTQTGRGVARLRRQIGVSDDK